MIHKIDPRNRDLFDTISPGDTVETWDGIRGTVAAFVPITRECFDGVNRVFEADLLIYTPHTCVNGYGYEVRPQAGAVFRRVLKYSSDLFAAHGLG